MAATVLGIIAPLFGLILLGYLTRKRGWMPAGSTPALNAYVVWLAIPAMFFRIMAESELRTFWQPGFLLAFGAGTATVFALAYLVARRGGHGRGAAGIDALIASYPNTGYMGIPLCIAAFGDTGLQAALIACVIPVTIVFMGAIMLLEFDRRAGHGLGAALRQTARQLGTNPLILAPLAGIAWNVTGLSIPGPVRELLMLLGASATPCALVNIGLFLAETATGGGHGRVGWLLGLKLVVQPAITALVALSLHMPPVWASAAILLTALPTGTGPFMLATHYRLDSALPARTILLSTIVSTLTVTAVLMLFMP